jgi:localization factor PodJL
MSITGAPQDGSGMSAGVPWSVSAVDQDSWDAAREAARREGLSVGEWLEAAIRENARGGGNGNSRTRNPAANFDHRLDDLAEQINMLARRSAPVRPQPQPLPQPPVQDSGSEQIVASIDSLTERIDLMLSGMERAERNGGRDEIGAAIRKLDSRIESILLDRTTQRPEPEVDTKLGEMARVISQMSERLEQETAAAAAPQQAPTADELDAAVAEIMERQSALDGTPLRRSVPRTQSAPLQPAMPNPQFANFERQLKTIADEMESLRKSQARQDHAPIIELRRDIADLARSMAELAPRRTLESLEQTVEALARKVDRATLHSPKDNRSAQAVLTALEEIRSALANVRPAETFLSVEGDLNALSSKLDVINAKSIDGTTVARIQNQVQEVRDLLSNALPAQNLQAVVAQIESIAGKIEGMSMPEDGGVRDIVSALEQRIDTLAERIEMSTHAVQQAAHATHAAQSMQPAPNNEAFERIHERLDSLQSTLDRTEAPAPMGLDEAMRGLVERLDASEAKLSNLSAIERGISDLSTQFDKARANAMDVAERAAKTALRELNAARQTMPQQVAAAQQSAPSLAPGHPELPPQTPLAGELQPPRSVTVVSTPEETQPRFTRSAPVTVRSRDEFVATDGMPADYPLEPGSGAPRSRPTPVQQRIAQSEAAVADIAPRANEATPKTSDFIAAARRAAQAAAAEAPNEPPADGSAPKKSGIAGIFARSRRAVLLGLVVAMLGISVVRFVDVSMISNLIGGSETATRPQTPAKQTPPAAPKQQPVAPQTIAVPPEVMQRSMIPGIIDPTASLAPASGNLTPQTPQSLFARVPDEALTTQSTQTTPRVQQIAVQPVPATTPQPPQAPVQVASVTPAAVSIAPAPQTNANELPGTIGTSSLRQAALAGDPAAAFEIGERYLAGTGVTASAQEAIKWFERAVAKGSAAAAFRLGMAYEKGQGVQKDRGRARTNYVLAAEAGHLKAMHNLAVMIVEDSGPSGKPDYANAIPWFHRAAERGLRDSQYNLGVLYARGMGVSQNLAESFRWFSLAANQGDTDAAKKRDDVAGRLDQQTLVAARLAVQTWQPQPSDQAVNNPPLKAEWTAMVAAPKKKQK